MALYDDNTDRVVLTSIIDNMMARLDEKDKIITFLILPENHVRARHD